MLLDLRVLELLSSKLCHDLISPVSAINNGVELIEDIGGDVVDEAMSLIGNKRGSGGPSLRPLSNRLWNARAAKRTCPFGTCGL
jgi:histidine phosphotransferase ChpT